MRENTSIQNMAPCQDVIRSNRHLHSGYTVQRPIADHFLSNTHLNDKTLKKTLPVTLKPILGCVTASMVNHFFDSHFSNKASFFLLMKGSIFFAWTRGEMHWQRWAFHTNYDCRFVFCGQAKDKEYWLKWCKKTNVPSKHTSRTCI